MKFQQPTWSDLESGFLVFLIAMPLSLGISLASGCPPTAGVITAIIGGIVASFIGSSPMTIKGPAAGLIGIVLAAVSELGNGQMASAYPKILAVGVAASILQIIMAQLKWAKLGTKVPSAVVHGLLSAIGVIIISKQSHVLLGVLPHSKAPLELLAEIPESFAKANPEVTFVGILTLFMLFIAPLVTHERLKKIPAAVIALGVVIPLSLIWHFDQDHIYTIFGREFPVGPKFLVNLPDRFLSAITFPDFSVLTSPIGWKHVFMFSIIASIESTLTVVAIDTISKQKPNSDLNADLTASGIANLIASFLGGLPMISEIVRSKANFDNGAKTYWSNAFHGIFLLIAVLFGSRFLHEIPLSALSGMLIFTGLRLASPKQIIHAYHEGIGELLIFLATLVMTLATDLLIGVGVGLALELVRTYVIKKKVRTT